MKSPCEITEGFAQFCGTEAYTRLSPLHGRLLCTDGVVWLAENADAFWLIDAIASHQPRCMKDEPLREIQFWTLKVAANKSAVLSCKRDEGDIAFTQKIKFTDFPLKEVELWVEAGLVGVPCMVCLLPSEH